MADSLPSFRGGHPGSRRLFDALDEGVVILDAGGTVRDWNEAALRMLALTAEQLHGRAPLDLGWEFREETHTGAFDPSDPLRSLLRLPLECERVTIAVRSDRAATRWITIATHMVHDEELAAETIVATMTDVTGRRETERENERYRQIIGTLDASYRILEESPIGMCSVDVDGNVLRSNMAFLALGGADATSIVAMVPDEDRGTLQHAFKRLIEGRTPSVRIETRVRKPTGNEAWCEITAVAMRQGLPDAAILLLINDVTERRLREVRLRQLAEMDPLTGLHNRRSFVHALRERLASLERPRRAGGDWALLLIDLDGFKDVNDTCGHAAGDAVLVAVAAAIRDRTRLDDTVGRLGGDEFAVLFRSGMEDAVTIGEQIITRIALAALSVPGTPPVSASVGIVRLRPARRAEEMLEAADDAMYQAKRAGKARVVEAVT